MQTGEIGNAPLHLVRNNAVLRLLLDAWGKAQRTCIKRWNFECKWLPIVGFCGAPPRILGPTMGTGTCVGEQSILLTLAWCRDARDSCALVPLLLRSTKSRRRGGCIQPTKIKRASRLASGQCVGATALQTGADVSSSSTTALLRQVCKHVAPKLYRTVEPS